MAYGCGRHSEAAWTALVTAEGERRGHLAQDLAHHMVGCEVCQTEYAELTRAGLELRRVLDGAPQAKAAFVARVMADVTTARRAEGVERSNPSTDARRGIGWLIGHLVSRPATLVTASALALLILVAWGVLPWPAGREATVESTGYTIPGGTIMSLAERAEILSAALTTQGVAAAAAGTDQGSIAMTTQAGAEPPARPIHTSLGIAVAQVDES